MRFTKKLNSLSNVTPGATATLALPLGVAYEIIKFKLSGITPAQMHNLMLKINGKTVQTFKTGSELQQLNAYKGYADDATGYLTWYFVKPELKNIPDQRLTKLGTQDVQTLTIEFDVDAAAVSPVVSAVALISNNAPLGVISKVLRFSTATSVAGIQEIDNIPTNGARLSAVHFKKADIADVEVRANNMTVYEAERVMAREFQDVYGRVPDTNYFHVDFTLEGVSDEALVTQGLQDFRFKVNHEGAGGYDFIAEYIDTLHGGV